MVPPRVDAPGTPASVGLSDASERLRSSRRADGWTAIERADGFATRVVAHRGGSGSSGAVPTLTPAGARVLRELPSLLTVPEIATLHGVSAHTVRTHLRSLSRKLEVSGRREAVEVA